jgi:hypothetical protein
VHWVARAATLQAAMVLAATLLAAPSACTPTPSPHDAAPPVDGSCVAGAVEVGGSGGRFLALPSAGGSLDIVRGAQGGIHLLVGFRLRDFPLELSATYHLRDIATGRDVVVPTVRALRPGLYRSDATGVTRVDDLLVLDNDSPRVEDFAGRDFSLEVELLGDAGLCARDARRVTLR